MESFLSKHREVLVREARFRAGSGDAGKHAGSSARCKGKCRCQYQLAQSRVEYRVNREAAGGS